MPPQTTNGRVIFPICGKAVTVLFMLHKPCQYVILKVHLQSYIENLTINRECFVPKISLFASWFFLVFPHISLRPFSIARTLLDSAGVWILPVSINCQECFLLLAGVDSLPTQTLWIDPEADQHHLAIGARCRKKNSLTYPLKYKLTNWIDLYWK